MSEMSEKSRADAKEKVKRLTDTKSGAVDASGWTEAPCGLMETQKKLGNRPISKQNLATGGRAALKHGGRKGRDMGGPASSAGAQYVANVPAPPQNRFSFTGNQSPFLAAAGMNKGGKAKRAEGGKVEGQDPEIQGMRPKGGRYAKAWGGWLRGNNKPAAEKSQEKADSALEKIKASAPEGSKTSVVVNGKSGRAARASGGSAGKGKTNINIIIAQKPDSQMGPMDGPNGAMLKPPPPPAPPPGGMPPPPPGAGPNMPPPSMSPGAPPPAPMGRASGGKVYPDMKYAASGGCGRLEKAKKYGKQ